MFKCGEFDGCTENYCAYEGEEECHWRNMPVEGCDCAACERAAKVDQRSVESTKGESA